MKTFGLIGIRTGTPRLELARFAMLQGTVKNLTRIFAPRAIGRLLFIGTALHFSLFADYVAPSGLAPGSSYMVLFVTSQTTDATNTDLSYYNTFVNDSANNLGGDTGSELASLGATWTVFGGISTAVGYADYQADPGVPVYNVNGDLIAAHRAMARSTIPSI